FDTVTLGANVTITGLGADQLTISGNHAFNVFTISNGVTATITGLTITGGKQVDGDIGGNILNDGTLNLSDSTISDGLAALGGGIGGGGGGGAGSSSAHGNGAVGGDGGGGGGGGGFTSGGSTGGTQEFSTFGGGAGGNAPSTGGGAGGGGGAGLGGAIFIRS